MTSWRRPLVVGGIVLVVGLSVAALPEISLVPPVSLPERRSIPDRMAGWSWLTGDVADSPPGRAIALFRYVGGLLDSPQAITVGAELDRYRRVDLAADRAGPPAPVLLSPEGARIAVGDHDTDVPDLVEVTLWRGTLARYPTPGGRSVVPLAWSPDGLRLAYSISPQPTDPYAGTPTVGDVSVLDIVTGTVTPVATSAWTVAVAPDGTALAVQHGTTAVGALEIVDLDGGASRTLDLPPGQMLDGPDAWSPDGSLLALTRVSTDLPDDITFLDPTGRAAPSPIPRSGAGRVLGWSADDQFLVLVRSADGHRVQEWAVDGVVVRELSTIPAGDVANFQLARDLLRVREAGPADRGLWPPALRVVAAILAGMGAFALTAAVSRRGRPRVTSG